MKSVLCFLLLFLFAQTSAQNESGAAKGHLVIHGGGILTRDVIKRFAELGRAKEANSHLVIVPTSGQGKISTDPETASKWLKSLGFEKITILHTRSKEEADSEQFVEPLKTATAIWFSGGRQWRTMDVYHKTKSESAFHDVYQRGGVIGGSSAGATVQGSYLVRGAPEGNQIMMANGHEDGFGFLENVAIDQHAIARDRLPDMIPVIEQHPKLLGISIDEGTALVVHKGVAKVIGKSKVAIFDRTKWSGDAKKYELLDPGDEYNFTTRQKKPNTKQ